MWRGQSRTAPGAGHRLWQTDLRTLQGFSGAMSRPFMPRRNIGAGAAVRAFAAGLASRHGGGLAAVASADGSPRRPAAARLGRSFVIFACRRRRSFLFRAFFLLAPILRLLSFRSRFFPPSASFSRKRGRFVFERAAAQRTPQLLEEERGPANSPGHVENIPRALRMAFMSSALGRVASPRNLICPLDDPRRRVVHRVNRRPPVARGRS